MPTTQLREKTGEILKERSQWVIRVRDRRRQEGKIKENYDLKKELEGRVILYHLLRLMNLVILSICLMPWIYCWNCDYLTAEISIVLDVYCLLTNFTKKQMFIWIKYNDSLVGINYLEISMFCMYYRPQPGYGGQDTNRSSSISILGLPLWFLTIHFPLYYLFQQLFLHTTWPIQFFFCFITSSSKLLFLFTSLSICSFIFLSLPLSFTIPTFQIIQAVSLFLAWLLINCVIVKGWATACDGALIQH